MTTHLSSTREILGEALRLEYLKISYAALSRPDSGYFECQMSVLSETEKAIQFDADNSHLSNQHRGVWIPKSQMEILDMGKDSGIRYFIKNWLYSKLK